MKLTKKTIVGGAILLAGAYFIYRYFKSPKKDDISTTSTPDAPSSSLPNPTTTPAKPTTTTTDPNKGRIDLANKIVSDYKKVMSYPNYGIFTTAKMQVGEGAIWSDGSMGKRTTKVYNTDTNILRGAATFVIDKQGFIIAKQSNRYYTFSPFSVGVKSKTGFVRVNDKTLNR